MQPDCETRITTAAAALRAERLVILKRPTRSAACAKNRGHVIPAERSERRNPLSAGVSEVRGFRVYDFVSARNDVGLVTVQCVGGRVRGPARALTSLPAFLQESPGSLAEVRRLPPALAR